MAVSSLEVDLSGVEEGNTLTVKWRGKPVFIRYRTEQEIEQANDVVMSELRDPQTDADRAVNPKVRGRVFVCRLNRLCTGTGFGRGAQHAGADGVSSAGPPHSV